MADDNPRKRKSRGITKQQKTKKVTPPKSKNGGSPAACTTVTCPLAMPDSLPASCKDAPAEIQLPKNVNDAMQNSFKNSFPSDKSQERGGTLVKDNQGNIKVVNESSGTSGTFSPNRSVGSDETIIGTYHTHPYDKSEGGHQGVSFSGADIAYANAHKEPIYVDAGNKQFMIMPTQATKTDSATINKEWNEDFRKGLKDGKSIQEASATASNNVAKKYGMAYYEGSNGKLTRVSC